MPLPFPTARLRLPERALEMVFLALFFGHLARGFRRAGVPRLARGGSACGAAPAREFLGALPMLFEHEIRGFLARERVLAEILVPARAPFLECLAEELLVAGCGQVMALDLLVERGPELFGLRVFGRRLLGFRRFRLALAQFRLERPHLLLQIQRGGALFGGVIDVAGNVLELVAQ